MKNFHFSLACSKYLDEDQFNTIKINDSEYSFEYFLKYDEKNLSKIINNWNMFYNYNPYDLVIPKLNFLIKDPNYTEILINNIIKRYYKGKPLYNITEYDPFYFGNFFTCWEVLKTNYLIQDDYKKFGFISDNKDNELGFIEATIKYCEETMFYEKNKYIYIPLVKLDLLTRDKNILSTFKNLVTHEFIDKIMNNKIVDKINNYYIGNKFDFIFCYNFNNLFSLLICNQGATVVLRIDPDKNLYNFLALFLGFFAKIICYQPICQHPLNGQLFMILKNFKGIQNKQNFLLNIIKNQSIFATFNKNQLLAFLKFENSYDNKMEERYKSFYEILFGKKKSTTFNFIKNGIDWCNNFEMLPKSYYSLQTFSFQLVYQKFTFSKNILIDNINISKNNEGINYYPVLHKLKKNLNKTKKIIDTKEQNCINNNSNDIVDWNKLTDYIDLYRHLKTIIMWKFDAEIVTNSWLKFYEIIENENLVEQNINKFDSFHICEAPGSFVSSLNHYIFTKTNIKNFNWYAQSLNPNNSNEIDQFGLIENYINNWVFGDITNINIIKNYEKNSNLQNIDLITADGEFKSLTNMSNEQEIYQSKVIFGEFLTILHVLPKNSNALLKLFLPMAENFTVSLIFLLTTFFDNTCIVKPSTSHPNSSEIYIVCKKFLGKNMINPDILSNLLEMMNNFDHEKSLVSKEIMPKNFIKELETCSKLFVESQIKSIQNSLYYRYNYLDNLNNQKIVSNLRENKNIEWITNNRIKKLTKFLFI